MLAFDVSNYTGPITIEQAYQAKQQGYTRAIVQIIDPPTGKPVTAWREQVGTLLAVGFEVEAYVYLYLRDNPVGQVQWALNQIGMLNNSIRRLWLDVEDTGDIVMSIADRQWALWNAMQTVINSGRRLGIYTGKWWWDANMPGVEWVRDYCPLWVADYDGVQNLSFTAFGGWSNAEMKQFAGDSTIATTPPITNVDLDYFA